MTIGPLYHASRHPDVIDGFLPLSHFGTLDAANARAAGGVFEGRAKRLYEVTLDITNPLEIPDLPDTVHSWLKLTDQLSRGSKKVLSPDDRNEIFTAAAPSGQNAEGGTEALVSILRGRGYDAIRYVNVHEDAGSVSWIILDPETVTVLSIDGEMLPSMLPNGR